MATLEEEEVDVFEVGAGAGEVGFDEVVATSYQHTYAPTHTPLRLK